MLDEYPDIICGYVGGGSNFSGAAFPFIADKIQEKHPDLKIISCEPLACPTLTKGEYRYDFGDSAGLTPLLKMYTLGHSFVPSAIHAGRLRYHGDAPLLCRLTREGYMEAVAYHQNKVFEAAKLFAQTEGIVVAPETAHAVKAAIDFARIGKQKNEQKTIVFANSGHGHFDLAAYGAYNNHRLTGLRASKKANHGGIQRITNDIATNPTKDLSSTIALNKGEIIPSLRFRVGVGFYDKRVGPHAAEIWNRTPQTRICKNAERRRYHGCHQRRTSCDCRGSRCRRGNGT